MDTITNDVLVRAILWFCSKNNKDNSKRIFRSSTRLQKLVFIAQNDFPEYQELIKNKTFISDSFSFTADMFGPYSWDLKNLIKDLIQNGEINLITDGSTTCYEINDLLKQKLVDSNVIKMLKNQNFLNLIGKLKIAADQPLDDLLKYIYQKEENKNFLKKSRIIKKYIT